ncbi:Uncharacterized protein AC511_1624 [Pseudomonas coronafaciens pv. oryzae]|nr:Uncharacterized protein AC511_1624 [Pseudomonas coronafaciens pv. oryzae]
MRTVTQAYFEQQAEADQPPALGGEAELDGLSFQKLRQANVKRLASSKYKLCEQNWQPAHWMNALTGETGECANIIKKVDRGDYSRISTAKYRKRACRHSLLSRYFGVQAGH